MFSFKFDITQVLSCVLLYWNCKCIEVNSWSWHFKWLILHSLTVSSLLDCIMTHKWIYSVFKERKVFWMTILLLKGNFCEPTPETGAGFSKCHDMFYDSTQIYHKSSTQHLSVFSFLLQSLDESVLLKSTIKSWVWTWPDCENSCATECKSLRSVSKTAGIQQIVKWRLTDLKLNRFLFFLKLHIWLQKVL